MLSARSERNGSEVLVFCLRAAPNRPDRALGLLRTKRRVSRLWISFALNTIAAAVTTAV